MSTYVKRFLGIFAAVVIGSYCSSAFAAVELITLTVWNEENYITRGLQKMAARVDELTGGEVKMRVEFGGSLGYKGAELLGAVGNGELDIAEMVASNVAGDAPVLALRTLPMMINSWEEVELFDELAKPYYDKVCEDRGQVLLMITPWPFGGLWANERIEKIDDMKDLKIRSYDRNGALFAQACKAQALNVPYAETYTALATGLINSTVTSSVSVREGKFYEVCNYHMPIRFSTATSITTINKAKWDALTPEQQQAMRTAASECDKFLREEIKRVVAENDQFCYDNGVTLVEVSDEYRAELAEAADQVIKDWTSNNSGATDAIELIEKFMEAKKGL